MPLVLPVGIFSIKNAANHYDVTKRLLPPTYKVDKTRVVNDIVPVLLGLLKTQNEAEERYN
jgi:hypothetical protein